MITIVRLARRSYSRPRVAAAESGCIGCPPHQPISGGDRPAVHAGEGYLWDRRHWTGVVDPESVVPPPCVRPSWPGVRVPVILASGHVGPGL